jgi:hypothetical protein
VELYGNLETRRLGSIEQGNWHISESMLYSLKRVTFSGFDCFVMRPSARSELLTKIRGTCINQICKYSLWGIRFLLRFLLRYICLGAKNFKLHASLILPLVLLRDIVAIT